MIRLTEESHDDLQLQLVSEGESTLEITDDQHNVVGMHPNTLAAYDKIQPGFAVNLLTAGLERQIHRRDMEELRLKHEIVHGKVQLDIQKVDKRWVLSLGSLRWP